MPDGSIVLLTCSPMIPPLLVHYQCIPQCLQTLQVLDFLLLLVAGPGIFLTSADVGSVPQGQCFQCRAIRHTVGPIILMTPASKPM